MFSLAGKFLRHVLPGVVRPARVLWNQLVGFLFLVLAAVIASSAIRHSSDPERGTAMAVIGILFGVFLAYFGVTSFLRARRISRQH